MHVDGRAVRACVTAVSAVAGEVVARIEARAPAGRPRPLRRARAAAPVPQCGYRHGGMPMPPAGWLATRRNPSDAEIHPAITSLCRRRSDPRVRAAIGAAAVARGCGDARSCCPVLPARARRSSAGASCRRAAWHGTGPGGL